MWLLTLAVFLLTVPGIVLGLVNWQGSVFTVIGLALLLMPATREYVAARPKKGAS